MRNIEDLMICLLRWFLLATCLWTLGGAMTPRQPIGCASTATATSSSMVDDWVSTKCGPTGQQLWKYEGALYDPLDGRRIASVEGLEWVSLLRSNETADQPIYSQVLNHPNATWKCAASMWSKQLFCYALGGAETNTNDNDNGKDETNNATQLLRKLRIRPYSPEKLIPLDQAAAVYETATTLIERANGELLVHSEWPSLPSSATMTTYNKKNQTKIHVWGVASSMTRNHEDGTLGFSIYCKRRAPKSPLFLPDLTKEDEVVIGARSNSTTSSSSNSMVVSPKRAKWVQFGISNMETKHKFGARETYSMTNVLSSHDQQQTKTYHRFLPWNWFGASSFFTNKQNNEEGPRLRYTRYGEGPPFYAPGRMCMLELQAEPIDSLDQASPIVQELLRTQVQGWNRPSYTQGGNNEEGTRLQLLPEEGDESRHDRLLTLYKGHALAAWERVRSVTNVVSFFRKERGFWSGGG
jgi:hypothetical protein